MLNSLVKAALVITSFAPILFTYAFVLWIDGKQMTKMIIIISIALLFTFLSLYILNISKRNLEVIHMPIDSIKTAGGEIVGFLIAYLLPFTSLTLDKVNESVLIFIMVLFFLVIWSTNTYHVNPLLALFRYNFYEITTAQNITFLLITKKDLRNTRSIKKLVQLTDYMVLDID